MGYLAGIVVGVLFCAGAAALTCAYFGIDPLVFLPT